MFINLLSSWPVIMNDAKLKKCVHLYTDCRFLIFILCLSTDENTYIESYFYPPPPATLFSIYKFSNLTY